ncbi:head-tail connector protein [Psychrobacter sp. 16-MNA-CIBAN-0192]|uniref:head-tail connector protein n=1 Tax=Psychrobacter sp. 16-MNA-CIBAN-0192 TaxID=3140448 RepID=UPI003330E188
MYIVSIETALHHLRADADDSVDVQHKLDAAQEIAEQFMGRRIYANFPELLVAINVAADSMPVLMAEKESVKNSNIDAYIKAAKLERIDSQWYETLMVTRGIATNKAIEIAILLILGTLYEHREDVVVGASVAQLPQAAEHRLQPYRIMGV